MSLSDLHCNAVLFNPIFGGDRVLYRHLFFSDAQKYIYVPGSKTFFGPPPRPADGLFRQNLPKWTSGDQKGLRF